MYEACILHARADRALRAVVAQQLEHFDVTMTEWLMLGAVCSAPSGGYSMSKLAALLDVTMPQVTALIGNLTGNKLVRQKTQSKDRRSRHVIATAKGRAVLADVEKDINSAMRLWLADIPKTDLRTYLNIVHQLAHRRDTVK